MIDKAKEFATQAHKGQTRDDGQDFIVHPAKVFEILSLLTDDEAVLAAAWLHDTIEDTDATYDDILKAFGREVADLVHEVTHEGKEDSYGYYFPRLKSHKGIMLKFADRLSNIATSEVWPAKRAEHYLRKSKFWKDGSDL